MAPNQEPAQFEIDVDKYREAAGLSVLSLSDLTGIARTSLRRKLAQPGLFTLNELNALCLLLGIPREAFEPTA